MKFEGQLSRERTFKIPILTSAFGTQRTLRIYSLISAFGTKLTDGATCVIVGPSSLLSLD